MESLIKNIQGIIYHKNEFFVFFHFHLKKSFIDEIFLSDLFINELNRKLEK